MYKEKVEKLFQDGNAREAWKGVKTLVGLSSNCNTKYPTEQSPTEFAEDLNNFYCRFEQKDLSTETKALMNELTDNSVSTAAFAVLREDVENVSNA